MIAVKVTYAVKESYIELNKEKISAFLKSFEDLDKSLFIYSVFQIKATPICNSLIPEYKKRFFLVQTGNLLM